MPQDNSSRDTSIPPPLDPFPTYQTPYPRPDHHQHENPFIQFRRFADEQFSSLFRGIPTLFGVHSREFMDQMRRRDETEEGWRKEFEQGMEEVRHELGMPRATALRAMEDVWTQYVEAPPGSPGPEEYSPWLFRGGASKCPALNGRDVAGQATTELDMYDGPSTNSRAASSTQGPWPDWLTPGDVKSQEKTAEHSQRISYERPYYPRPTRYSLFKARHMNPFDDPDQTIPWLMLSPYSPFYLCNPGASRIFRLQMQDMEEFPLEIARPQYFESWYTEVDDKLARRLPWADAFEDLVSLQQTGSMVDRNHSTRGTPTSWIHDMVCRRSLGDRWGVNEDGKLFKRMHMTTAAAPTTNMVDRCQRRKERRWGPWRRSEEAQIEQDEQEMYEDSIDKLIDDLPESITRSPFFGGLVSAADSIVSAVEQGIEDVLNQSQEQSTVDAPTDRSAMIESDEPESTPYTSLANSSSSSYSYSSNSSSSYSSSSDQAPSDIISTLTKTVTRTLPDGSVETKRVFKKRFADGTEENDESVEVNNGPPRPTPVVAQVYDKQTQTQHLDDHESANGRQYQQPQQGQENADRIRQTYGGEAFQRDADQARPASDAQPENPRHRRGSGWFWTR